MKYLIAYFFIFGVNINKAQTLKILDNKNHKPIPYAIVLADNIGYYTNSEGELKLNYTNLDSLKIKHVNYYDLNLKYSELSDSIFLKPKTEILKEITLISYNNFKEKEIKSKTDVGFVMPIKNSEVISCLEFKKKYQKAYLNKVSFEIGNNLFFNIIKNLSEEDYYILRLNIYESSKKLYPKETIRKSIVKKVFLKTLFYNTKNKISNSGYIDFYIQDLQIDIIERHICLGLEVIDTNLHNKKLREVVKFQPKLTQKKNKYMITKTYFRNVFNSENELKTYFESLPSYKDFFNNKEPKLLPYLEIYYKK